MKSVDVFSSLNSRQLRRVLFASQETRNRSPQRSDLSHLTTKNLNSREAGLLYMPQQPNKTYFKPCVEISLRKKVR